MNKFDPVPVGTFVYVSIKGYIESYGVIVDVVKDIGTGNFYYKTYMFEECKIFGAFRHEFYQI